MAIPPNQVDLKAIARQRLLQYGFLPELPPAALAEAARSSEPEFGKLGLRDLTSLLWSSIDNDDSRDLDQIEFLENGPGGTRLYIAIADVASFVMPGSALDGSAEHNTTSLYLGVETVPMLPEALSYNLTSLVEGHKRLASVVEMLISPQGELREGKLYRAIVQNQAQLTYHAVAAWLEDRNQSRDREGAEAAPLLSSAAAGTPLTNGRGSDLTDPPLLHGRGSEVTARVLEKIRASQPLQEQLRLQHELAEQLRHRRAEAGALPLETVEVRPEPFDGRWDLTARKANAATQLIEDFMIAANRATVAWLGERDFPALRRVVRTPKDWPQLVQLAAHHGASLPPEPDSIALEHFLLRQKQQDPERYADLSLAVIKLLGRGEYLVSSGQAQAPGHFGLAVEAYAHSTAPNRRYPDVITQRLVQAALASQNPPYGLPALDELARHCTQKEDDAKKMERSVHKSVVAAAMSSRVGETFEGMITGASTKGVWVRLSHPPVEGKLEGNTQGCLIGRRVRVKLVLADPWRGYLDFRLLEHLPSR